MNCKILQSGPKSGVYAIPKPNQWSETRMPESISFASQVSSSRISMRSLTGPRWARGTARIEAATAESLYEVLGIGESVSSVSDIKKAYKEMARKYHPDVSPPERVDENTRRFIMVKEAYETLSNPQRRALYDRNLAGGHHYQKIEENDEWKMRWQSQLDELKRRSNNISRRERVSWGARMRTQI
ncbi:chaperone protein dnaJ 20, chloroplastic-like [Salvia miltiorrhiza]|uniref:chaperone protein dnaJ 20, chloroplastic-like n=1 Tax=Salvia miltiorrhiza TaxID=226208 RepID=UPI0025AC0256|nr:chaperone protein dnaJ 20, chloroplastic-like [Salvia miltiorrhiza]